MKASGLSRPVSVVIPCYNGERYLAEAIDSVLAQPHRPLEIVVVDDGSNDGSAGVARRYGEPVRLLSKPHRGIAAARNAGIQAARGDFLAFLDADDLWSVDKLALQLRTLDEDPDVDCVFAYAEQFHSPDLPAAARAKIFCPPDPLPGKVASAMLVRRSRFLDVGLFDESLAVAEFVDWMSRAEQAGLRSVVLPQVLLRRRLHGSNTGMTQRALRADYARALKAALDRRRNVQGSPR